MTPVRAPDGSDPRRMPRGRQPVVDRGADLAPLHGRIPGSRMAGYEQDDAIPGRNRPLQSPVDGSPGLVQRQAMKVEHAVRLDRA